jgi:hypothetical protein
LAALLLLIAVSLSGLDISEEYIETFLHSLPHRLIYWTRSELDYGRNYFVSPSFAAVRIDREDTKTTYSLIVSDLAAVKPHQGSSYKKTFTHYFYFVPTAEEFLELSDPAGREIQTTITNKPLASSETAVQDIRNSVSEFASLARRYARLQDDDSGEQFWGFFLLSFITGGLTAAAIYGIPEAETVLDAAAAVGMTAMGGLLTVFNVGITVGYLMERNKVVKELRNVETRLVEIQLQVLVTD